MSTQLYLLIMFLLLTYLLFRRPAENTPHRNRNEQNQRIGHAAKQDLIKSFTPLTNARRGNKTFLRYLASSVVVIQIVGAMTFAQVTPTTSLTDKTDSLIANGKVRREDKKESDSARSSTANKDEKETLLDEMLQMRQVIEKLEARIDQLEAEISTKVANPGFNPSSTVTTSAAPTPVPVTQQTNALSDADRSVLDFFRSTTVNLTLDGYYGYNFNRPVGRINLLRAYDVQSNSFSINQATLVIERAPDVEAGRRFGGRLDLMFGQATEAGSGNPGNELRPQAYRHIWQAYGTYVAPLGSGLTLDFGKFASSFGLEGNYTKDQINYTRSYLFNYLPYYHVGLRSNYAFNDKINVTHYLVNGIGQSEDFNGFKSQALLFNIKPTKSLSWNVNYYTGIEARDSIPALNPGFPALPTQPGLPTDLIKPAPRGRTHIFDTYATLNATDKLTLAAQFDYVVSRAQTFAAPAHITGGAAYARYQFTPKFAFAGRAEYFSDRGGLFSGVTQALKETTLTAEYKFDEGMLLRAEWRRDFTNQLFFLTNTPGLLKKEQNTATLGVVWWFGRKQGGW